MLRALNWGTLPTIYLSDNPENDLLDYVGNYLKEKIKSEGLARNIGNFSRFLQVASLLLPAGHHPGLLRRIQSVVHRLIQQLES